MILLIFIIALNPGFSNEENKNDSFYVLCMIPEINKNIHYLEAGPRSELESYIDYNYYIIGQVKNKGDKTEYKEYYPSAGSPEMESVICKYKLWSFLNKGNKNIEDIKNNKNFFLAEDKERILFLHIHNKMKIDNKINKAELDYYNTILGNNTAFL